jgi:hypothetical protein
MPISFESNLKLFINTIIENPYTSLFPDPIIFDGTVIKCTKDNFIKRWNNVLGKNISWGSLLRNFNYHYIFVSNFINDKNYIKIDLPTNFKLDEFLIRRPRKEKKSRRYKRLINSFLEFKYQEVDEDIEYVDEVIEEDVEEDEELQAVQEQLQEAVPDAVQEAVPDAVQEAVPDAVQEAVPDAVQEAVPDAVQEADENSTIIDDDDSTVIDL